ncbi:MAG TPA: Tm-1-like ATP-binding domain-containing protein [Nocardioidaceae bacterium]|nr:Tm-1-like ATP-binding domain-containing protein [Nocardioidaceae bacterium]
MRPTIAVLATLDTKGPEAGYLRDRLHDRGLDALVVDCGILEPPLDVVADVSSDEVARHSGASIAQLRESGTRGQAVAAMRTMLADFVEHLYAKGTIAGAIGIGGAEGAVMTASAMMRLPIGVPKVVISPIASGRHEFGPLVGTRDMMVVHSVVDILGLNGISRTIFDNAVAAVAGMVEHGHGDAEAADTAERTVAVTMLGNTTRAVMALRDELDKAGFTAMVFHSNGVGGPAMEELAAEGYFRGVVDFTTNEVTDPLVGGIHDGGPDRLRVIGELGLPQVVVPGCIDFAVFEPSQIPPALADRPSYDHNPEFRLIRTSPQDMLTVASVFAERLSAAKGPIRVAIPTEGLSIPNVPGGPFWDPTADAAFRDRLRTELREDIPISTHDYHVNDPEFGRLVARLFLDLVSEAHE